MVILIPILIKAKLNKKLVISQKRLEKTLCFQSAVPKRGKLNVLNIKKDMSTSCIFLSSNHIYREFKDP